MLSSSNLVLTGVIGRFWGKRDIFRRANGSLHYNLLGVAKESEADMDVFSVPILSYYLKKGVLTVLRR